VASGTKKRGYETIRDMLLSLGVILAGVLVFVALQPKNHQNPIPAVDWKPQVDILRNSAKYPVVIPDPVPAGWEVNYARIGNTGATELHLGLVKDRKRFAQLDETDQPSPRFFSDGNVPPTAAGTVTINGVSYEVRRNGTGSDAHAALVRSLSGGATLTLSDGGTESGASYDELVALAGSLRDQPVLSAGG
jgi:hypothetical protein